ncbi:hypothetical protein BSLG_004065 [Batrachochytrium salamandrivorans]|nr:hypothetical protein BSLG_004065 [Batrachochytrium salamandrivorans]
MLHNLILHNLLLHNLMLHTMNQSERELLQRAVTPSSSSAGVTNDAVVLQQQQPLQVQDDMTDDSSSNIQDTVQDNVRIHPQGPLLPILLQLILWSTLGLLIRTGLLHLHAYPIPPVAAIVSPQVILAGFSIIWTTMGMSIVSIMAGAQFSDLFPILDFLENSTLMCSKMDKLQTYTDSTVGKTWVPLDYVLLYTPRWSPLG